MRVCSHFEVPAPIAARIQRTQVPFPGQTHAIGRQRCQAGIVECQAGAYQVATASLARDVVVRRWALDEQLTEDADGAGRQLELARDHWLAVAHCCRAFREEVIGRHHADSSTPKKAGEVRCQCLGRRTAVDFPPVLKSDHIMGSP